MKSYNPKRDLDFAWFDAVGYLLRITRMPDQSSATASGPTPVRGALASGAGGMSGADPEKLGQALTGSVLAQQGQFCTSA